LGAAPDAVERDRPLGEVQRFVEMAAITVEHVYLTQHISEQRLRF
jgi:hypothetical protein